MIEDAELDIVSPDRDKTLARVSKLGELFKSTLAKTMEDQARKKRLPTSRHPSQAYL